MSKTSLKEYYEKNHLSPPQYSTNYCGGPPHNPAWQSTVTLYDGTKIAGEISKSKSAAESSAAKKVLDNLTFTNQNKRVNIRQAPERSCLIVDIENMPNFIFEVLQEISDLVIYGFVGEHHCLANKEYPSGVIKIISPSTRTDGTDSCIQVFTGYLLSTESYNIYYIATRDHFGSSLVEMISSNSLPWNKTTTKTAKLVTQVSHIK